MKFAAQRLLLVSLPLTFAHAQTNLHQYAQHVIVVIQENRTPDNLFNQDSTLVANGGHVQGASGAPTAPTDTTYTCGIWPCYRWFDAENLNNAPAGCVATTGTAGYDIDPNSDTETAAYNGGYPCYTHNSLPTLLGSANPPVTWRYYLREGGLTNQGPTNGYTIWNAPAAISNICYPVTGNSPSQ